MKASRGEEVIPMVSKLYTRVRTRVLFSRFCKEILNRTVWKNYSSLEYKKLEGKENENEVPN